MAGKRPWEHSFRALRVCDTLSLPVSLPSQLKHPGVVRVVLPLEETSSYVSAEGCACGGWGGVESGLGTGFEL